MLVRQLEDAVEPAGVEDATLWLDPLPGGNQLRRADGVQAGVDHALDVSLPVFRRMIGGIVAGAHRKEV